MVSLNPDFLSEPHFYHDAYRQFCVYYKEALHTNVAYSVKFFKRSKRLWKVQ